VQPRRPVTIALARFEDLVARGLRALIEEDDVLSIVASDVTPAALDGVLVGVRPRVAVLNFGSLRSPADVRRLHGAHPGTRLIVLANRPSIADATQLLAFGATACLSKGTQGRDVVNAIHLASRGLQLLPQAPAGDGRAHHGPELLTRREADVLEHLRDGRSNAEIAITLHIGLLCVGRTAPQHAEEPPGHSPLPARERCVAGHLGTAQPEPGARRGARVSDVLGAPSAEVAGRCLEVSRGGSGRRKGDRGRRYASS
jgi:DNA-binding NarL/FixJ family response regulator